MLIGQIIQGLTTFIQHKANNPPTPSHPNLPAPPFIAALQNPVNPNAGNVKI